MIDRWTIINPTAGLDTYTSFEGGITLSGATVNVIWAVSCRKKERDLLGVHAEMSDFFAVSRRRPARKIILSYVGKGTRHACWTPSRRQSQTQTTHLDG